MNACVFAHRSCQCPGPPGSPSWRLMHAWHSPGHRVGRPRERLVGSGSRTFFFNFVDRTRRPASARAARLAAARSRSAHTRCWALSLTRAFRWRTRMRSMAARRLSICFVVGAMAGPQWRARGGPARPTTRSVQSRTAYINLIN